MPVSSDPITPTSRIGRYELLREIGRGGMAVLYEARHVHLDMRVAVKRPLASHTGGDVAQARFRNEALYAARIRHPNVIRIHDYDVEDGAPYIAMDLIEGSPLSAILAAHGPLPLHRVVDLLLAILSGISAVHAAGITHRDLKPHNLLIGRDASAREHPIIIDFGVAKSIFDADEPGAVGLTTSGSTLGTAGYMAPEQILSARDAGPLADQYSLAVTLYECLTGATPLRRERVRDDARRSQRPTSRAQRTSAGAPAPARRGPPSSVTPRSGGAIPIGARHGKRAASLR